MNTPNSAGSIAARLRSPIETLQQLRLSISNRDSPASPPSGTLPTANEEQSIEDIQSQPSSPSFSSAAAQFVKIETNVLTVMRALTLSEKGSECIAYGVLTKIIQCMEEHSETFVTMTEELKLHRRRGAGGSEKSQMPSEIKHIDTDSGQLRPSFYCCFDEKKEQLWRAVSYMIFGHERCWRGLWLFFIYKAAYCEDEGDMVTTYVEDALFGSSAVQLRFKDMIIEMPHFLEASEHNNFKEYIKLLSGDHETSSFVPGVIELGALLEWLGCRAGLWAYDPIIVAPGQFENVASQVDNVGAGNDIECCGHIIAEGDQLAVLILDRVEELMQANENKRKLVDSMKQRIHATSRDRSRKSQTSADGESTVAISSRSISTLVAPAPSFVSGAGAITQTPSQVSDSAATPMVPSLKSSFDQRLRDAVRDDHAPELKPSEAPIESKESNAKSDGVKECDDTGETARVHDDGNDTDISSENLVSETDSGEVDNMQERRRKRDANLRRRAKEDKIRDTKKRAKEENRRAKEKSRRAEEKSARAWKREVSETSSSEPSDSAESDTENEQFSKRARKRNSSKSKFDDVAPIKGDKFEKVTNLNISATFAEKNLEIYRDWIDTVENEIGASLFDEGRDVWHQGHRSGHRNAELYTDIPHGEKDSFVFRSIVSAFSSREKKISSIIFNKVLVALPKHVEKRFKLLCKVGNLTDLVSEIALDEFDDQTSTTSEVDNGRLSSSPYWNLDGLIFVVRLCLFKNTQSQRTIILNTIFDKGHVPSKYEDVQESTMKWLSNLKLLRSLKIRLPEAPQLWTFFLKIQAPCFDSFSDTKYFRQKVAQEKSILSLSINDYKKCLSCINEVFNYNVTCMTTLEPDVSIPAASYLAPGGPSIRKEPGHDPKGKGKGNATSQGGKSGKDEKGKGSPKGKGAQEENSEIRYSRNAISDVKIQQYTPLSHPGVQLSIPKWQTHQPLCHFFCNGPGGCKHGPLCFRGRHVLTDEKACLWCGLSSHKLAQCPHRDLRLTIEDLQNLIPISPAPKGFPSTIKRYDQLRPIVVAQMMATASPAPDNAAPSAARVHVDASADSVQVADPVAVDAFLARCNEEFD